VAALTTSPEAAETLARWGVRTLRELAALPEEGLAERLGPEGVRLHQLARGCGIRPLVPELPAPVFEETLELEDPVELLEPLAFLLARLLGDLCARLKRYGFAPQELRLRLRLADGGAHERVLRLPVPIRDNRALLRLLRLDLEAHPPSAPIAGVTLAAEPGRPRVLQDGLFLPPAPEPAKLEVTLQRIAGLVGKGNVGWPELEDTHRPDAFRLLKNRGQAAPSTEGRCGLSPVFLALRRFRPPLKAEVEVSGGRLVKIQARQVHGKVLAAAGPWRTAGEWWTPRAWDRDEFDVALSDGALYRLFRDRLRVAWFVEGSYD
jgi:protein ImuB